jgi:hypothetical protein
MFPKKKGQHQKIMGNYFRRHHSSSSFLLTWSRTTSPNWPWSLSRLVSCPKWMKLGCQVLFGHFRPVYILQICKVISIQEALAKFFAVHTLKFEILQTTWKNETKIIKKLNLLIKNWEVRVWCSLFHFFIRLASFQIFKCELQSIPFRASFLYWVDFKSDDEERCF